MNMAEWLKPALYGALGGAAAIAIVGFSWGGWMTGGTAQNMATEHARVEVVAALVPICVEQSRQDPDVVATLASLKDATVNRRNDMLMATGWATMPGAGDPSSQVARACMQTLAEQF